MASNHLRAKLEEDDRHSAAAHAAFHLNGHAATAPYPARARILNGAVDPVGPVAAAEPIGDASNRYTLMVAGQRTGKTSFLRLLLDTSDIAPTASKEQLASVAKFVQGCSGHTQQIRVASVDVDFEDDGRGTAQRTELVLVDTPSLDYSDENGSERQVSDMLRFVETKFLEGVEDGWRARHVDHHVHLCIYFLDPDSVVPPSMPGPPMPGLPRTRNNSLSQVEPDRVVLEPPVATNPLLFRPTLPAVEIDIIRRLSARVNVLPVIARADTLTNERLQAIKMAVRHDLASAGIGFGIFDVDGQQQYPPHQAAVDLPTPSMSSESTNGYQKLGGSTSSGNTSPATSPITPAPLRLPYALFSPDIYSHSDGVARASPSRHELVAQYTPSPRKILSPKLVRGRFVRSYRWGSVDVLDHNHNDFIPLRAAILHHMDTLQQYTKDYLFDRFRAEYRQQQLIQQSQVLAQSSAAHHLPHQAGVSMHLPSLPQGRPVLTIDTVDSHPSASRHSLPMSREVVLDPEIRSAQGARGGAEPVSGTSARTSPSATRSSKQRTKKITVACNFCRSRKLKCDGMHPCSQCQKRSNSCDYTSHGKRRGNVRQRKPDEAAASESDGGTGEDQSVEADDPSASPEAPSQTHSRRSSNVGKPISGPDPTEARPSSSGGFLGRDTANALPPVRHTLSVPGSPEDQRGYFRNNELPRLATLALPESNLPGAISAPLPPIRGVSDPPAPPRKRANTTPGKGSRVASMSGPKVIACNFCRARKTKCDGGHPACASCARRSLPCNYAHDNGSAGSAGSTKNSSRRSSSSKGEPTASAPPSPPLSSRSQHHIQPSAPGDSFARRGSDADTNDADLKRKADVQNAEFAQAEKRMRVDDAPPSTVTGVR